MRSRGHAKLLHPVVLSRVKGSLSWSHVIKLQNSGGGVEKISPQHSSAKMAALSETSEVGPRLVRTLQGQHTKAVNAIDYVGRTEGIGEAIISVGEDW